MKKQSPATSWYLDLLTNEVITVYKVLGEDAVKLHLEEELDQIFEAVEKELELDFDIEWTIKPGVHQESVDYVTDKIKEAIKLYRQDQRKSLAALRKGYLK